MQTEDRFTQGQIFLKPEQFNRTYLKQILSYPFDQELPDHVRVYLNQSGTKRKYSLLYMHPCYLCSAS